VTDDSGSTLRRYGLFVFSLSVLTKIIEKYHMTLDQWISWIRQEIGIKYIKTNYIYIYMTSTKWPKVLLFCKHTLQKAKSFSSTYSMCVPFYHVRCKSVMWLMTVGQPWDDMAYLFSRSLYKTICWWKWFCFLPMLLQVSTEK
jgi:hypothetical protein